LQFHLRSICQFRVARRCEPIREKSTAYKPLPITPRNTGATRRFVFCSRICSPMACVFEIKNRDPATRRRSNGRCIYCGSPRYREKDNRKLGEEHVIAESLGGSLIIEEASCEECEGKIPTKEIVVAHRVGGGVIIQRCNHPYRPRPPYPSGRGFLAFLIMSARPSELTRNSSCQTQWEALGGVLPTAAWRRSIARSIATTTWWWLQPQSEQQPR
jgi:HNH endonuclease